MSTTAPSRIAWGWLLAIVALVRALPYYFFSPDDYYIYLQFVRNVVERGEFSFNAGVPTFGFTSSLWLLLLSLGGFVGDAMQLGKLLSLATTILSPVLVFAIVLRLTAERGLAWLAGLVWAGNAWLVRWSASGLEAGFSATLALSVVWFSMVARERNRFPWIAAVAAAIGPFIRPEMIGLTILFVMAWAIGERRFSRALGVAALCAAIVVAGGMTLYLEFGRFLPNTAEAKGSMVEGLAKLIPSLTRIGKILASTSGLEILVFAVALGVWLAGRGWRGRSLRDDPNFVVLMLAWVVGVIALYGVRSVNVYTRYLLIFMPFLVIGGFAPLASWWRRGGVQRAAVLMLGCTVLVQNVVLDLKWVRPATIAYQQSEQSVNIKIGRWLAENTPPDAVIAVPDIGAIGYVSQRKILDLNGLVTPELIAHKRDKTMNQYLEAHPPDYIIAIDYDPDWLIEHGPNLRLDPVMSLPFEKMFIFQDGPLYYSLYRVGEPVSDGIARATMRR